MQKKEQSLLPGSMERSHSVTPDDKSTVKFPIMSYDEFMDSAKGPVAIPMTNDYLFRAVLQSNNCALTGLVCSLLHLQPEKVQSVEVTNPIKLGHAVDEKEFFLDVRVEVNKNTILNLELQVLNEHNWLERSLSYLCREFDHLSKGADYINVKRTIQIGLVNFSLFPQEPEFYATYKLMNVKTYKIYSDKLQLSVVDLTQINLATEEDKHHRIDQWAALFKATSWEEIKMLAQENDFLKEASKSYYQLSQEEEIRLKCEAREEYYRRQRYLQHEFEELKAAIAKQRSILAIQKSIIAEKDSAIAEKDSAIAEKDSAIAALLAKLAALEGKAADSDIQ